MTKTKQDVRGSLKKKKIMSGNHMNEGEVRAYQGGQHNVGL